MSLLGLPVVIYSPDLLFYPSDLNYVGTSFNDYFETVEQALREGWSSEWVRKTYRWLALEYGYSLIDISDSYSEKENAPPPPLPRRLLNRAWRTIQPYFKQERDCRLRSQQLKQRAMVAHVIEEKADSLLDLLPELLPQTGIDEETHSLRVEVARLLRALYPGTSMPREGTLHHRLKRFADGVEA